MKALSVFRPRIAPRVSGCLDEMIDQAVLDACIDFCERTLVVKRMLTPISTVASTFEYTPAAPSEEAVACLVRVWCDLSELTPLDEDAMATPFGFTASVPGQTNTPSKPRFFNETSPGSVGLYPAPDRVYTLNIRAALRPTRAAANVEDQLFEDWAEAIVDGALARLMLYPGEWANVKLASVHEKRYEAAVGSARLEASQGATRAQQRIQPVHI